MKTINTIKIDKSEKENKNLLNAHFKKEKKLNNYQMLCVFELTRSSDLNYLI